MRRLVSDGVVLFYGLHLTAGDGGVDVAEAPNGIACTSTTTDEALCKEQFQNNAVAALKVSPEPGFVFTGWTVNDAQIKTASSETLFLTTMPVLAQHGDWVTPFTGNIANCQVNCSKVTITAPPTVKRDEIFDVTLALDPPPLTSWNQPTVTFDLEGQKTENLPGRGEVQMYDFGYDRNSDGNIEAGQTAYTFNLLVDGGTKTIKAVYNLYQPPQTIKIAASLGGYTFESEPIAVTYQIRQYTESEDVPALAPVNSVDAEIIQWVDYWDDWNYPNDGEPYTFKVADITYDLVKAICYKESLMKKDNTMTVTSVAIKGLTKTGTSDQWLRDWNWSAHPDENGQYKRSEGSPYMEYTGVNPNTSSESIKWGIRWLYAYKTTASYDKNTDKMYNPQWLDWEAALSGYRSTNEEAEYPQKVMALYHSGKDPHTKLTQNNERIPIKPYYMWPIMTDGFSRDSGFSEEEKAYLLWAIAHN